VQIAVAQTGAMRHPISTPVVGIALRCPVNPIAPVRKYPEYNDTGLSNPERHLEVALVEIGDRLIAAAGRLGKSGINDIQFGDLYLESERS